MNRLRRCRHAVSGFLRLLKSSAPDARRYCSVYADSEYFRPVVFGIITGFPFGNPCGRRSGEMCKDLYKLDKMTNFAAVIYETL